MRNALLSTTHPLNIAIFLLGALGITGNLQAQADTNALRSQANAFFKPLPKQMPGGNLDTTAQIELGKKLYFETTLSINGTQSCNSCHRVDNSLGGVDNEATSAGALGKRGDRNSPTVWNAGFHIAQFWDGRAADLAEQAKGPILNPIEMGLSDEQTAIDRLKQAGYEAAFKTAFPSKDEPLTYDNMAFAIAAFERTLITQDRFDQFLAGDDKALSSNEQQGLADFINVGCVACHNGSLLGGQSYQKMGMVKAYPNQHDLGRFNLTKNPADRFVFKVPSLRDISHTAPYFHDGSAPTLAKAVQDMAYYQLGKELDQKTTDSIVAFLKALDNNKPLAMLDGK